MVFNHTDLPIDSCIEFYDLNIIYKKNYFIVNLINMGKSVNWRINIQQITKQIKETVSKFQKENFHSIVLSVYLFLQSINN